MFKFDPTLLTFSYHKLKSVTTALGGSINVVDPDSPEGHEELIKVNIPFAVARKFIKETGFTKYLKPVTIAILEYDGMIINLERDIAANIKDQDSDANKGPWVSNIESFITHGLQDALGTREWYFDGRYVYDINDEVIHSFQTGGSKRISADGRFSTVDVNCIDLYESNSSTWRKTGVTYEERGVIGFKAGRAFAITAPIWKSVTAIGSSAAMDSTDSDHEDYLDGTRGITAGDERVPILIDLLDEHFSLNLNFTMNTAKSISNIFGFESIEPLQLPEIMLKLTTVNIPGLPRYIKSTFSIGMTPSHALAWLMGLSTRCKTLDEYIVVRSCIKYLTSKGMFHRSTTNLENLFVSKNFAIPPQKDLGELRINNDC